MQRFEEVYEVVKLIPKGRATSYGAIAKYLNTGARLVGWAMNAAHGLLDVPAHRVVNRNGILTGKLHFESPTKMQELLEAEGHTIKEDKILKFKEIYWDPVIELDI
ncbi:MGMT family protein [Lacihabitans sp. LS3-19]|uniref:MGMT family protein n=1 Tax=Lacihabitans sp. LS3-19 TaxID=2487335 RepID=UPI0020CF5FCB|nr:MGMT family protein [Lacihabitans sp. LS3-19]MCP9766745.1 MGMT family protein [Lacihabitans sp. LS3-19]